LPNFIGKHFSTSKGTSPNCIDVSMVINETEVFRNNNIEINYIITNNGSRTLSSIKIELEFFNYINIIDINTSGGVRSQVGGKYHINENNFNPGESKNISFIASVNSNAPVGESTIHKPNSFKITYPDGRNIGSQKFSKLEIKNNRPNITSAYIDLVPIGEPIEADSINLIYNNKLYLKNRSIGFNLICDGYDIETPINELKYEWTIKNYTLPLVDNPNHTLDMVNYFPPAEYQTYNLFKVRVMDGDINYSKEVHPKFRGTNGEIIEIDSLIINDDEYYRKNISNLVKIILLLAIIYIFVRWLLDRILVLRRVLNRIRSTMKYIKSTFISKCNNIADSIENTRIRKLLKLLFKLKLLFYLIFNLIFNLMPVIIVYLFIEFYRFLYESKTFYVPDYPLISYLGITGPIAFRSLPFFQFYIYFIVFIFIIYFTERSFDKSTNFSLYQYNSIGMAGIAWFSITLLSDLIQLNPDHLHWYYSTSAQVFATILAIVAMWGASINKGLMGSKTSANRVILQFSYLYGLIVVISLVGLSIGTSANFNLDYVDISIDSDSIKILLPIIILQISLLLITPALLCLIELIKIILKDNNWEVNNQK
jgi:hypothetical protein